MDVATSVLIPNAAQANIALGSQHQAQIWGTWYARVGKVGRVARSAGSLSHYVPGFRSGL